MKTLFKAKWILPKGNVVIENGGLLVENNLILDVLTSKGLETLELKDFQIKDYGNSIITPGFINLHTHLQYTEIGKKKSKKLGNRLKRLILKFKKLIIFKGKQKSFTSWIVDLIIEYLCWSAEERIESFKSGLNKILLSGTTCVAQLSAEEMYFEILNSSPIKSYIFFETYADSEKSAEENFIKLKEKYEKLNKKCLKSTYLGISPHSFYNAHKKLWEKISQYASQNNILIHAHFAESQEELDWIKTGVSEINKLHKFVGFNHLIPSETGLDPVSYLKTFDLAYKNVILAHINQLKDEEINELATLQTSIAHCPRSNLLLHKKTVDINKLIKLFPSSVGLGTDSLYSNYDLNIINEARNVFNSGVDLFTVLDMLTINSAKILGIEDFTGSLEKEKDADFLIFKLEENEDFNDFIKKEFPDHVFITGLQVVKDKKLVLDCS